MNTKKKSARKSAEVFERSNTGRSGKGSGRAGKGRGRGSGGESGEGPAASVLRTVFDPALSPGVVRRLERAPSLLRGAGVAPQRLTVGHALWFIGGVLVAELCLALMVLLFAPVSLDVHLAMLVLAGGALGVGGTIAFRRVPGDLRPPPWLADLPWRHWALVLSWLPIPLFVILSSVLSLIVFAACAAAALWVGWRWPRGDRLALANAHRYLVPQDFGERATPVLQRVQWTIDRVVEADGLLGDSFDGRQSLGVLRSQEWEIAQAAREYEALRSDYLKQLKRATSERVTNALRAQFDAQEAAFEALTARSESIGAYGREVEAASIAHWEWEQVQHIGERERRITGLLARTSVDGGEMDVLQREGLDARAARQVRDELVDRALSAGQRLQESVSGSRT